MPAAKDGFKQCRKCGGVKAVGEFSKDKARKDGLQCQCKTCQALVYRQYRQMNPEKERERIRQWREANPEKPRESKRNWREANPEKLREYDRQWYQANTEKSRESKRRRRARKKGIVHAVPSNIEEILFDAQNGYCMYCQRELLNVYHLDHIVPLALADLLGKDYPGHVPSNLCLTCEHCNMSKNSSLLEDWLARKYPNQMNDILYRVECHIETMREWEE